MTFEESIPAKKPFFASDQNGHCRTTKCCCCFSEWNIDFTWTKIDRFNVTESIEENVFELKNINENRRNSFRHFYFNILTNDVCWVRYLMTQGISAIWNNTRSSGNRCSRLRWKIIPYCSDSITKQSRSLVVNAQNSQSIKRLNRSRCTTSS